MNTTAASHNILDLGRCSSNALESVPETHTPHTDDRFAFIRSSRAITRAAASSAGTARPVPKYISSGVWPSNAQCGMTSL